jgi:uncharacterized protein YcbX
MMVGSPSQRHEAQVVAHVAALYIYPLKSARGVAVDRVLLDERGIVGDRRWMLTDLSGKYLGLRAHPRLALVAAWNTTGGLAVRLGEESFEVERPLQGRAPWLEAQVWSGPCQVLEADREAAARIGRFLGIDCRLVYLPDDALGPDAASYGPFRGGQRRIGLSDGAPLLVTNAASLDDLNCRLDTPVTVTRFRPNMVLGGAEPWAEDRWSRLAVRGINLRVVKPCPRCAATTVDEATGERGTEPLRTLASFRRDSRGVNFGVKVAHEATGTIAVGDGVAIFE